MLQSDVNGSFFALATIAAFATGGVTFLEIDLSLFALLGFIGVGGFLATLLFALILYGCYHLYMSISSKLSHRLLFLLGVFLVGLFVITIITLGG